jgi:hypothetical protein
MPFGPAIAGAAVSGGLGLASAAMQSGATSKAAGQTQRNLQMILPQMQTGYNQTVAGYQPYTAGGAASTSDMADLLGLNGPDAANAAMAKFQSSPGYQFQLQQGLRGVDAGAAAQGMLRSGATLKAEQTFGQGLAAQDFGNYFNRLSGLAGQGLTAQGGIATANQNLVANEEGNATAQNTGIIGAANAQNSIFGNTAQGLGNTANSLLNNQAFLSMVNPSANYGSSAFGTPGISASGNPVMSGFAPAYTPGQVGVGGFVAPSAPAFS